MDRAALARRVSAYERLMRLDKPIGTLLLLWPTLWALWLASDGRPRIDHLLIFFTGTVLMRSAGCAINDYADREFDPHVARTRARPLAAGEIEPREALAVAAVLALVAFGFGIPMAYAAVEQRLPPECWLLLAANVCYAFAYDTEYAMVDRDDDARLGIRTSALTLGRWDVGAVMAAYALMLALLAAVGMRAGLGWPFHAGLAAAGAMMVYHWFLIRGRSREGCFKAFMHNNWVGAAVFAGIVASFLLGEPA